MSKPKFLIVLSSQDMIPSNRATTGWYLVLPLPPSPSIHFPFPKTLTQRKVRTSPPLHNSLPASRLNNLLPPRRRSTSRPCFRQPTNPRNRPRGARVSRAESRSLDEDCSVTGGCEPGYGREVYGRVFCGWAWAYVAFPRSIRSGLHMARTGYRNWRLANKGL